jgi:hypothetical protein
MLTAADRNWLERTAGPGTRRMLLTMGLACGFLVLTGMINLALAMMIGGVTEDPPLRVLWALLSGIQPAQEYLGLFMIAQQRLFVALGEWGMAAWIAVDYRRTRAEQGRSRRILAGYQELMERHAELVLRSEETAPRLPPAGVPDAPARELEVEAGAGAAFPP